MGALAVKGRPTNEAPSEALLYNKLSRWASVALVLLVLCILITLQYRLWWGEGSLKHTTQLEEQLFKQQLANDALQSRNDRLLSEIATLKKGTGQIEARAREDLGLVKDDETFFMFFDEPIKNSASKSR
ncbi:septum formation initiator family protein [Pseudomonadales bacterium]|jgi:cell division protein FtsB|nr:septum formation initiator family protein [Pseudomonadales bacterium]MDB4090661.1 septum formation initiator family protein [Pseudomonadales bacterium]MDB4404788.1 septum formation initiator family protein [bacterium]